MPSLLYPSHNTSLPLSLQISHNSGISTNTPYISPPPSGNSQEIPSLSSNLPVSSPHLCCLRKSCVVSDSLPPPSLLMLSVSTCYTDCLFLSSASSPPCYLKNMCPLYLIQMPYFQCYPQ